MLVVLALILSLIHSPKPVTCGQRKAQQQAEATPQYFFWNEITGEKQWEDPGDVAFEDESGIRYWIGPSGDKLSEEPNSHAYNWVEYYSEDLQRAYYFNQETKETTWNKPIDLAWRRVPVRIPR